MAPPLRQGDVDCGFCRSDETGKNAGTPDPNAWIPANAGMTGVRLPLSTW